jgi:hypothetical protein
VTVNIDWGLTQNQPDPVMAFIKGQEIGSELRARKAKAAAMQLIASGDFNGGMAALVAAGDLEGATSVEKLQSSQNDRLAMDAARPHLAAGRPRQATQAAMQYSPKVGGDLSKFTTEELTRGEATTKKSADLLYGLAGIKDPAERAAERQRARQTLIEMEISDAGLARFDAVPDDPEKMKGYAGLALDVAGHITNEFKRREDARDERRLGETIRHNEVIEGQADTRLGYEGERVGMDRKRLDNEATRLEFERTRLGRDETSPSNVIGGILAKKARGEPTTPAEDRTMYEYSQFLGGMMPEPRGVAPPSAGVSNPYDNANVAGRRPPASRRGPPKTPRWAAPPAQYRNLPAPKTAAEGANLQPGDKFWDGYLGRVRTVGEGG